MADEARQSGAETRRQIMEAATGLLEERGAAGLNVSAIMARAAVSRTAFYRQFDDVYGVAAAMLGAIADATALDTTLRSLWRETVLQPRTDASAAAIRRDQAAGVVPMDIDPDSTALALTLMGEQVALEVLGRRDGSPEEYASILAPIWESVLFGHEDQR